MSTSLDFFFFFGVHSIGSHSNVISAVSVKRPPSLMMVTKVIMNLSLLRQQGDSRRSKEGKGVFQMMESFGVFKISLYRVATAQGKQGIWLLTFPDRENTGNLVNLFFYTGKMVPTQGKFCY